MIKLLDQRAKRIVMPLSAALLSLDRFGLIPELFEIFGQEALLRFLDIFAGQTFKVPDHDTLTARIRDVIIWIELENETKTVAELAEEYGLSDRRIREIRDSMRSIMTRFQILPMYESIDGQQEE